MDIASNLGLSKAASFRSMRRGSQQAPSHHPSEGRKSIAGSRAALLLALNNNAASVEFDRTSETSSMEERRYAALLGPDRDYDAIPEFGEVHEAKNVGHRLYISGVAKQKAREEKLRARREKIILKELNELTTKPSITNHARAKPSKGSMFADHSEEWLLRREERLALTADKVRADRERELTASPSINKKSAEIAESSGYRGPVAGWEEHFAKYYAKKSCAALQAPPPGMFTPNVNHTYRNAHPEDVSVASIDVSSRLYEDAVAREEKQKELREREFEQSLLDPYTKRPYFTPSRVDYPIARPEQTPEEAGARLHSLWEDQQKKREEKAKATQKQSDESKFRPAIDPHSVQIGERRRRPLYEKKDLSASLKSNTRNAHDTSQDTTTTKKISTQKVEEFLRRTDRSSAMRQQRLEQIRNSEHERQTNECTFKPAVNRKSMEIFFEINQYGTDLADYTTNRRQKHIVDTPTVASAATPRTFTTGAGSPRTNSDANNRYGYTPSASPITTGRSDGAQGGHRGGGAAPTAAYRDPNSMGSATNNASAYAQQFEQQMFQVLDEWRRLEDV